MRRNIMTVSSAALGLATPLAAQTSAQPVTGPHASDVALEGQVRAALARELGPTLGGLTVAARDGVVALSGKVADATRRRAERTAAGVSGGNGNSGDKGPANGNGGKLTRSDAALETSARNTLVATFGPERAGKVQVQVRNGIVSVRGMPGNQLGQRQVEGALAGLEGSRGLEASSFER